MRKRVRFGVFGNILANARLSLPLLHFKSKFQAEDTLSSSHLAKPRSAAI